MQRVILSKQLRGGELLQVTKDLDAPDWQLRVSVAGKVVGNGEMKKLQRPQAGCTHYIQAGGKAYGLTPEDVAEIEAGKQALLADAEEAIRSGKTLITLHYSDGSVLSGYTCHDRIAARLLVGLGLAREVAGWGVHVSDALAKALGERFAYAEAAAFAAPAIAAKEAKQAEVRAKREAIFAEARRTGERQKLSTYTEECDGSVVECSTDVVTVWAMPDGTTQKTRVHTF